MIARNPKYDQEREKMLDQLAIAEGKASGKRGPFVPRKDAEMPYLTAKTSFELDYPYGKKEVAEALVQALEAWDQYPAYTGKNMDPIQLHLGIKHYKVASLIQRYLSVSWNVWGGISVSFYMPSKTSRTWLGIDSKKFLPTVTWEDIADAVIQFAQADLETFERFRYYKNRLNLTLAEIHKGKD